MMAEKVVTLEPELTEKAKIKCACIGRNAKDMIFLAIMKRAEQIEKFQAEFRPVPTAMGEAALGYAKMLKELARLIQQVPDCKGNRYGES